MQPPESCTESAAIGDTLHIHYTVRGLGGRGVAWDGRRPAETRQLWLGHVASCARELESQGRLARGGVLSPASFSSLSSAGSSLALRIGLGDLQEVLGPWGFLFLFAHGVGVGGERSWGQDASLLKGVASIRAVPDVCDLSCGRNGGVRSCFLSSGQLGRWTNY